MAAEREATRLENPPGEAVFSAHPEQVGVEITARCNLRCKSCFNDSRPDRTEELPLSSIVRLLDEMVSWGLQSIRISGGEPTLHSRFTEVIRACEARGLSIALNSNGIWSPEIQEYLQGAPIERFLLSLDGLGGNNDAIRGSGTFRKVLASTYALREAGQLVTWGVHVNGTNRGDLRGLVTLAAGLGADVKVSPIRPVGRARGRALEVSRCQPATAEDLRVVVNEISTLRERFPRIRIQTDFDVLDPLDHAGRAQYDGMVSCKAGRTMVNVAYDGSILPCAFFHTPEGEFSAGNLHETSVGAVWATSPVFRPFRTHRKAARCRGCEHYAVRCVGGCPAVAHFGTGALDACDPTCFLAAETPGEVTS